jgi:hypothetical protein
MAASGKDIFEQKGESKSHLPPTKATIVGFFAGTGVSSIEHADNANGSKNSSLRMREFKNFDDFLKRYNLFLQVTEKEKKVTGKDQKATPQDKKREAQDQKAAEQEKKKQPRNKSAFEKIFYKNNSFTKNVIVFIEEPPEVRYYNREGYEYHLTPEQTQQFIAWRTARKEQKSSRPSNISGLTEEELVYIAKNWFPAILSGSDAAFTSLSNLPQSDDTTNTTVHSYSGCDYYATSPLKGVFAYGVEHPANDLYQKIIDQAKTNDKINVHLVGHSRGCMSIIQLVQKINADPALKAKVNFVLDLRDPVPGNLLNTANLKTNHFIAEQLKILKQASNVKLNVTISMQEPLAMAFSAMIPEGVETQAEPLPIGHAGQETDTSLEDLRHFETDEVTEKHLAASAIPPTAPLLPRELLAPSLATVRTSPNYDTNNEAHRKKYLADCANYKAALKEYNERLKTRKYYHFLLMHLLGGVKSRILMLENGISLSDESSKTPDREHLLLKYRAEQYRLYEKALANYLACPAICPKKEVRQLHFGGKYKANDAAQIRSDNPTQRQLGQGRVFINAKHAEVYHQFHPGQPLDPNPIFLYEFHGERPELKYSHILNVRILELLNHPKKHAEEEKKGSPENVTPADNRWIDDIEKENAGQMEKKSLAYLYELNELRHRILVLSTQPLSENIKWINDALHLKATNYNDVLFIYRNVITAIDNKMQQLLQDNNIKNAIPSLPAIKDPHHLLSAVPFEKFQNLDQHLNEKLRLAQLPSLDMKKANIHTYPDAPTIPPKSELEKLREKILFTYACSSSQAIDCLNQLVKPKITNDKELNFARLKVLDAIRQQNPTAGISQTTPKEDVNAALSLFHNFYAKRIQQKQQYNSFLGKFTIMSAQLKFEAVKAVQAIIKGEKVKLSDNIIAALNDGSLGKFIKLYTNYLPPELQERLKDNSPSQTATPVMFKLM